jgi:haloacetate dehalogenase
VKIACPTIALWGADFGAVGKMFDMPRRWAERANDLRAAPIERCGNLPHEQGPEAVNALLLEFLRDWRG